MQEQSCLSLLTLTEPLYFIQLYPKESRRKLCIQLKYIMIMTYDRVVTGQVADTERVGDNERMF